MKQGDYGKSRGVEFNPGLDDLQAASIRSSTEAMNRALASNRSGLEECDKNCNSMLEIHENLYY